MCSLFAFLYYSLTLFTSLTLSLNNFEISSWNTTIINTFDSNHSIPLTIHYPSTNISATYPMMIFYHGWECFNTWYDFIWRTFVPKGYIIVLPNDYTQENTTNELKCSQTQRFTLDWMKNDCNSDVSCPLYSMIGNHSIASGHSMGGGTSLISISSFGNTINGQTFDHEFDAAFILAGCGSSVLLNASENIKKPIFLMTGTHDCMCEPSKVFTYYHAISNDTCKFLADITNGTHCGFMDAPKFHERACNAIDFGECPLHSHVNIQLEYQISIILQYMALFLDASMVENNNVKYMRNISIQLEKDETSGVMSVVESNC